MARLRAHQVLRAHEADANGGGGSRHPEDVGPLSLSDFMERWATGMPGVETPSQELLKVRTFCGSSVVATSFSLDVYRTRIICSLVLTNEPNLIVYCGTFQGRHISVSRQGEVCYTAALENMVLAAYNDKRSSTTAHTYTAIRGARRIPTHLCVPVFAWCLLLALRATRAIA